MKQLLPPIKTRKRKRRAKSPDKRPARARYWATRRLEERKIKNLMRHCGMSKQSAYNLWHRTRKTRVKDGYLRKVA